jgi:hypothetical protein
MRTDDKMGRIIPCGRVKTAGQDDPLDDPEITAISDEDIRAKADMIRENNPPSRLIFLENEFLNAAEGNVDPGIAQYYPGWGPEDFQKLHSLLYGEV